MTAPSNKRTATARSAVVVIVAVAAIYGGGVAAISPQSPSGAAGAVLIDIPTVIEDYAGVPIEQMSIVVQNEVAEVAHSCMRAAGWEYPEYSPRTAPEPVIRIPVAQMHLDRLLNTPVREPEDQQRKAAEGQCWKEALASVQNPASEILAWVAVETEGIYDNVGADHRVLAARRTARECVRAAGYSTVEAAESELAAMAITVTDRVGAGSLDLSVAKSQLEDIAAAERELWVASDRCLSPAMNVERTVAIEAEATWLAANLERLYARIDMYRSTIEALFES